MLINDKRADLTHTEYDLCLDWLYVNTGILCGFLNKTYNKNI